MEIYTHKFKLQLAYILVSRFWFSCFNIIFTINYHSYYIHLMEMECNYKVDCPELC